MQSAAGPLKILCPSNHISKQSASSLNVNLLVYVTGPTIPTADMIPITQVSHILTMLVKSCPQNLKVALPPVSQW